MGKENLDTNVLAKIETRKLKEIVTPLLPLLDSIMFEFKGSSGFRMLINMPGQMHGIMHVKETAFNYLRVNTALGEAMFPVNLASLNKNLLRNVSDDELVNIEHDEDMREVIFRVGNLTHKQRFSYRPEWQQSLYKSLREIEEPRYDCDFEMQKATFNRGMKAIRGVGHYAVIMGLRTGLNLTSDSLTDEVSVSYPKECSEFGYYENSREIESTFLADRILATLQMIDDKSMVRFSLSECKPLRMVWQPFDQSVMRVIVRNMER